MADEIQSGGNTQVAQNPPQLEFGEGTTVAETPSSGSAVSLSELERAPKKEKSALGMGLAGAVESATRVFRGRGWLAIALLVILFLLFLFLPPISLGQQLLEGAGYTALTAENASLVHPDGLTLAIDPAEEEKIKIKLSSLPRADFLDTEAGKEFQPANEALPTYLTPKSPYYQLAARGENAQPLSLTALIPNEAEPWETLDLYSWNGEEWQWVPSRLDRAQETLVAEVATLPSSLMVMQTAAQKMNVATEAESLPTAQFSGVLDQVDLVGMKIGTLGELNGDAALLPPGSVATEFELVPTVRNWIPNRQPNQLLVADMLLDTTASTAQRTHLVELVKQGQYPGLVLDYRALVAENRAAYSNFVAELAVDLHAQQCWLAVTVETPQLLGTGWETAGYDWAALGAAADQIHMVMPAAPLAYAPGGEVEQLLSWATTQVNRYKLHPLFSTLSTDGTANLAATETLSSLGKVATSEPITSAVEPGTELTFQLGGDTTMSADASTGALLLQTTEKNYWLGTASWLRARLDLLSHYNLGGVVLNDLLDEGNFPGMLAALDSYRNGVAAAPASPTVIWQVTAPDGSTTEQPLALQQATYSWTAPEVTGAYQIGAQILGNASNAVTVEVAKAAEIAAATEEEEEEEPLPDVSANELQYAFITDVTVPDNTSLRTGTAFTKTWRVKNTGEIEWPRNTKLTFLRGTQLTDDSEITVGKVASGAEKEISIPLTVPEDAGSYETYWALTVKDEQIPQAFVTVVIRATGAAAEGVNAQFVTDVTVPDNTHYEHGEQFVKTWRVRNNGSEPWPEQTKLTFLAEHQLTEVSEVAVGAVAAGAETDISVDLMAPNENGTFRGQWALTIDGNQIPDGLMFVVIKTGEEAAENPNPAPAPAPAPVAGGSFELGGHIQNTGFPSANIMHYAGMNWAKVQVRYPGDANGIIAAAHANGFKIQVSALGPAGMVTDGGFNDTVANWLAGIAAAGADAIEVWNEPNLPREWQEGHINPEAYTQLLCKSYASIKAANPGTAVISAAPAPTGYFGGCHAHGCDDLPWLQRMYNAGAANCMDFIGAHHNAGATSPSATSGHPADPGSTHHSWFFLPQTQLYYNTFGGARQLFYTELGYVTPEGYGWIPATFAWGGNTTVAQQAQWLAEVVSLSSQTGMVRAVIVWNVDFSCYGDCGGVQDPQAGYAIIRPDGSCPACESLHALLGTR
ncbi:MAG: NBR1-Ig-like domain-containing protein [Chloroflexota bacterium]|nr:NBR1-Ig-like domain-containing protein [Chloroflexota bacterium]